MTDALLTKLYDAQTPSREASTNDAAPSNVAPEDILRGGLRKAATDTASSDTAAPASRLYSKPHDANWRQDAARAGIEPAVNEFRGDLEVKHVKEPGRVDAIVRDVIDASTFLSGHGPTRTRIAESLLASQLRPVSEERNKQWIEDTHRMMVEQYGKDAPALLKRANEILKAEQPRLLETLIKTKRANDPVIVMAALELARQRGR